ncbi:MAG TPA: ATP synthase F1 subunit delta [Planctomycetota bacterium]|nr:ATP synthase F1 subunit delta [Planctomycetota bacterium]
MAHKDAGVNLADIYAEALHDAASAAGELPRIEAELLAFMCAVIQDDRVMRFLDSPVVPFSDRRRVIESALSGFHRITRNFILVVVQRNRVELIPDIGKAFRDHANRVAGIAEFRVTTAERLEPTDAQRLRAMIEKRLRRPVILAEAVRPALMGGMILEHEDFRWNWSVAQHLRRLVAHMGREQTGEALWTE